MRKLGILFAILFVSVIACGEGSKGEECGESGKVDGECEDGLVCGKKSDTSEDLACLKQCTQQGDCASGESCNGVSGTSLKGCRPGK